MLRDLSLQATLPHKDVRKEWTDGEESTLRARKKKL